MLYSKEKCTEGKNRPHFSLWFGNFFEPYFSDRKLVEKGMEEIASMGFNSIILDSKLWEDFTEFFNTGKESDYVAMQKFMIEEAAKNGMGINFLTLFYNGDNLYPHIRSSKPDIISPVIDRNGNVFRGLKHWDDNQTDALVRHTVNLYKKLAKDNAAKAVDGNGNSVTPCYFYHSPALMPSFDDDGKSVYIKWLSSHYGSIDALNREYGENNVDFDLLDMLSLWPEMLEDDYKDSGMTVRMKKHRDNMLFRQDLLEAFYDKLTSGVRKELPQIFLYDCLSQWKYFLTDWVEISERGLNLWKLGKYLDSPSFYTLPADAYGEANCYAVSYENAILRSACAGKDPVSGLFLGRYLYNDIYEFVTPAESIASCYGAGATDMFFYGYSGLDDGGNFGKWDKNRKLSVKKALDWFSDVRAVSGKRKSTYEAAILFPYATFTMDNRNRNGKAYRACRNDSLGYYKQLCDLGINPDIIDRTQLNDISLNNYSLVLLPADPFYEYLPDKNLEKALKEYVTLGGTVICSASCGLFDVFDIKTKPHKPDSIAFEEKITEFGEKFISFDNVESLGEYCSDNETALGVKHIGKGNVYVMGVDLGTCYVERVQKPVPVAFGNEAHYPLTMINRTPIEKWLFELGKCKKRERGIEKIPFETGILIINHTSYDYEVDYNYTDCIPFGNFQNNILGGHEFVFLKND